MDALQIALATQGVVMVRYTDRKGQTTERAISPTKITPQHVHAMCLGHGPRMFRRDRLTVIGTVADEEAFAPMPVTTVSTQWLGAIEDDAIPF